MLDPQILTEAKLQATKERLTVGNVIEEALTEYLKKHTKSWEESLRQQLDEERKKEKEEKEKQRSSTPTFNFG
jgi:DNA gyrase/topoisomerase IV subunit B